MSIGLIALLDDVAALAKVAAASLDDVGAQAAKAGAKAAGVVIDDAAVTPRYVVGFSATRELPIVGRIALGSLRNKLLFLLPGALGLSLAAPWAITPLLMAGGAYLSYEGAEKVWHALAPHGTGTEDSAAGTPPADPVAFENARVRSAIGTDFILSAEIMAITLGTLPGVPLWEQAVVLAIVGVGITVGVYGVVALIVKADDVGLAMANGERPISALFRSRARSPHAADLAVRPVTRAIGRGLVVGMPWFLRILAVVGTAAMVWVGGGILVHALAGYGFPGLEHAIGGAAKTAGQAMPAGAAAVEWIVTAAGSGVVGLVAGAAVLLAMKVMAMPLLHAVRRPRTPGRGP